MLRNQGENQISTPETTLKNTPYRSNGISKTLLTPCRRLGLSRRFKTTPNDKIQEQLLNTSYNSSPVSIPKSNNVETSSTIKNEERVISKERTRSNNEINRPVVEDVDDIVENKLSVEMKPKPSTPGIKMKTNNKKVVSKKKTKSKQKTPLQKLDDPDLFHDNVDTKINSKDNSINPINLNDCTPLENISVLKEIQASEIQLKVKDTKKSSNSRTSFARRLSMKKTYSQDELTDKEEFLSTPKSSNSSLIAEQFTKECNVVLEDINCLDDNDDVGKPTPKKLNKKRCIIYSSDEDDFVSSQPTNEGNGKNERSTEDKCDEKVIEDLNEKVNQIKSKIKQKEEQLAELKQAVIYKKLHNVTELDQLTRIWKKGCQDGLRHLLTKLREHAEMDMPTLMKNLNVPTTIVYNVDTDSFV